MKPIITLLCCMVLLPAAAQRDLYFSEAAPAFTEPYWTTLTDPVTGTTSILLFGHKGQILYSESLPAQVVKPSRKNIRRMDKMLALMASGSLISQGLETIPFDSRDGRSDFSLSSKNNPVPAFDSAGIGIRVYASHDGKLNLYIRNPEGETVEIILKDDNSKVVYFEKTALFKYGRSLNVSGLGAGSYGFFIQAPGRQEKFRLTISSMQHYELAPQNSQDAGLVSTSLLIR